MRVLCHLLFLISISDVASLKPVQTSAVAATKHDEPIISQADLKAGDVLCFTTSGDTVSQFITKLTGADVAHSAIVYEDPSHPPAVTATKIIECWHAIDIVNDIKHNGVNVNEINDRFTSGRTIYVRRFIQEDGKTMSNMEPIMSTAKGSIGTPYVERNLYMLAGMVLLRHFAEPKGPLYNISLLIIETLTAELINCVNANLKKSDGNRTPLVCSEFVYKTFQDTKGYRLDIPDLQPRGSVLDQVLADVKENGYDDANDEVVVSSAINPSGEFFDKLFGVANDIVANCEAGVHFFPSEEHAASPISQDFKRAVTKFCRAIYALKLGKNIAEVPVVKALEYVKENEFLFATPGDLKSNTANLEKVGKIIN